MSARMSDDLYTHHGGDEMVCIRQVLDFIQLEHPVDNIPVPLEAVAERMGPLRQHEVHQDAQPEHVDLHGLPLAEQHLKTMHD